MPCQSRPLNRPLTSPLLSFLSSSPLTSIPIPIPILIHQPATRKPPSYAPALTSPTPHPHPLVTPLVTANNPTPGFDPVIRPRAHEAIPAGSLFTIVWDTPAAYAAGSLAISLIGGDRQDAQETIANLTEAVPNAVGRYTWSVSPTLGNKRVYGLVLRWSKDTSVFQYSNPFHIMPVKSTTTTTTTAATNSSRVPERTPVAVAMSSTKSSPVPARHTSDSSPSVIVGQKMLALLVVMVVIIVGV
ncbi:Cell wall beta-glucan synthesis [Ophiocordyceps camponoti-floridani]|uniref:Cell wall beta-glucan synthesis n=1 Tax=Ophiocordyceps camponoti-floridani TaxID=2030778 RepID=A0A8H4Q2K1_9HYPO|nr:Cell wall beta-glucan synthesis [Ophiocordyceps camponoti-floridani]